MDSAPPCHALDARHTACRGNDSDRSLEQSGFDPARSDRSFTLLTPDIGEVAFLPEVMRYIRQAAPRIQLKAVSKPNMAAAHTLESVEADLADGFFTDLQLANFFQQALFKTAYSCIACAHNRSLGPTMTLAVSGCQPPGSSPGRTRASARERT